MKLFSNCCFSLSEQDKSYRDSYRRDSEDEIHGTPNSKNCNKEDTLAKTPLKVKLINSLGLKDFLIDSLIFSRKKSTYKLQTVNNRKKFHFSQTKFTQIQGYDQLCDIIQTPYSFIPVIYFRKKPIKIHYMTEKCYSNPLSESQLTMIYSHGNSSDLEYCYRIVQMMVRKYPVNFVIYDYTGYGNQCLDNKMSFNQKDHKLSQQSICLDLKCVIQWSKVPHSNIILWGFSLGCYPSLSLATQFQLNSIILQCPFASIFHFIQSQSSGQKIFKQDMFNNIELITKVKCKILLIHSQTDQIIPIRHSRMLLDRFNSSKNENEMRLIEISNIKHNEMSWVLCLEKENQLQLEVEKYLVEAVRQIRAIFSAQDKRNIKYAIKNRRDLISINSCQLESIVQSIPQIPQSKNWFSQSSFGSPNTKQPNLNQIKLQTNQTKHTEENQVSAEHEIQPYFGRSPGRNSTGHLITLNETEFYKKSRNYSFDISN